MRNFLFLLASSRVGGNSEILARHAAKGLDPEVHQQWLRLSEYPLGAFKDVRHHTENNYELPEGNAHTLLRATLAADAIVFVCPLYWYSLPAPAKLYLDHWSHWMRVDSLIFKQSMQGKRMYLTSAMAGSDAKEADPMITSLKLTTAYMNMLWGGHVLAHANAAGDVLAQEEVLKSAEALFTE